MDLPNLIYQALITELELTPKPGLVDLHNTGAHRDMDQQTFYRSAEAIRPFIAPFIAVGKDTAHQPATATLIPLRDVGLRCEQNMLQATQGVNTHKGSIFAFGLLAAAFGRLGQSCCRDVLCNEVAAMCAGMVERELTLRPQATTAGERLYHQYGLSGARGEAESGFRTACEIALPVYLTWRDQEGESAALLQTLLTLLAWNEDTNLAARGGIKGLRDVQQTAKTLLQQGGAWGEQGIKRMAAFDQDLIQRNLSPGGSADLLAITWFLAHFE